MSNQLVMCGKANSIIPTFAPAYLDTIANISTPISPPIGKHDPIQEISSVLIGPIGESSDCKSGKNGDVHPIRAPCENVKMLTEKKSVTLL
jgi:hypothetical protein